MTPPRPASVGAVGFTLVEVVVALAVGAIVILAGFSALALVQDRSAHAADATVAALEGATARATLYRWIADARLQSQDAGVAFEGNPAGVDGRSSDEILFPTLARTPVPSQVSIVRLYLDDDPSTPETGLVAEFSALLGEEPLRVVVVPEATGLQIRYLPDGGEPGVAWTDNWVGQGSLPRGVELILDLPLGSSVSPLLRLPLRIPLATLR
jgi:prepilin-type N-terminal cleavage/methylation domain-containing protein